QSPVGREIQFNADEVPDGEWGCTLLGWDPPADGVRRARMRIVVASDAAVGEYTFRVVAKDINDETFASAEFERPVVVLFNAWDDEDAVYLSQKAERDEYVLNTKGVTWLGTAKNHDPKYWGYNQFDEIVFLTTLDLLDGLGETERADPVEVSRWLTEKLDSIDGGVLFGCWCGSQSDCYDSVTGGCDWSGGSSIFSWDSSDELFAEYDSTGNPVKYAQCWIYAGALTSSLRTLGVATRSVVNFESGHDADGDLDITFCYEYDPAAGSWDRHYPAGQVAHDSYWNFHVWCEAWFERPTLAGMDGWQVVDATPQERSAGLYRLGPAPVSAVKAFELTVPFDTAFVVAEVDAHRVDNIYNTSIGACEYDSTDTTWIGRKISTKALGTYGKV
ncbi:MAG: transglutaminase domain-containing protein, partial [Phycisphaerales bacterium]|nr:transglutaminase domain-containing protein [Phycisphaerales bacterium]